MVGRRFVGGTRGGPGGDVAGWHFRRTLTAGVELIHPSAWFSLERRSMRMLLVGGLVMLALQVLLVVGAYMLRVTPEVVNCDRGRQSVEVHVEESFRAYVTNLDKYEIGECKLWFHS